MSPRWTTADISDQSGRVAVITGANAGIGYHTAKALAERGATVVMACRDGDRARRAAQTITTATPIAVVGLDLASLASVHDAARRIRERYDRLDLLINNAGVWWPPYTRTEDGFELQFGVNHLAHFALTGLLLELLLATPASRVVTVTSLGHRSGVVDFDDLHSERRYRRNTAYAQSKLANLLFTYELQRRLAADGAPTAALAAHPGGARTELFRDASPAFRAVNAVIGPLFTQPPDAGALPTLRAATDPHAPGGGLYGPSGPGQFKGSPVRVTSSPASHDGHTQARLWQVSERLTGVSPVTAPGRV
ncbi:oxidoreductase [Planobispora siamensis]|uniref:Short-chain dehydrogenase n=1 Tax=Planobispora siamensis TaxID=936338 RepID=A0A8J3SMR8_9ACTN|nr:oxidoreductase [Planobispora siamensis]GIH97087.1 short-chain dehydrogenase [Planobispora siamensis]